MIFALAQHLLESTCFAGVALLIATCLRDRSAAARHGILLAAVAKFAVPLQSLLAFGGSLRGLLPSPLIAFPTSFVTRSSFYPAALADPGSTDLLTGIAASVWVGSTLLFLTLWLRKLGAPIEAQLSNSAKDLSSLERMRTRIQLSRRLNLRTSPSEIEPQLCGLFQATIVLPEDLSLRLTAPEFEAVLLHELAHAKRWDNLTRACVHALVCVFWFYPPAMVA